MEQKRELLIHFLAALAYRTAKALHGAPEGFGSFRTSPKSRTPHELIRHMDSVLGYARTFSIGGSYRPPEFEYFQDAVSHFHEILTDLAQHLKEGSELHDITEEQLLQGPFSDAMTHAGQLALLRRLAGRPVPPENFVFAKISPKTSVRINRPPPGRTKIGPKLPNSEEFAYHGDPVQGQLVQFRVLRPLTRIKLVVIIPVR